MKWTENENTKQWLGTLQAARHSTERQRFIPLIRDVIAFQRDVETVKEDDNDEHVEIAARLGYAATLAGNIKEQIENYFDPTFVEPESGYFSEYIRGHATVIVRELTEVLQECLKIGEGAGAAFCFHYIRKLGVLSLAIND